jgi:hypothetical protein
MISENKYFWFIFRLEAIEIYKFMTSHEIYGRIFED